MNAQILMFLKKKISKKAKYHHEKLGSAERGRGRAGASPSP